MALSATWEEGDWSGENHLTTRFTPPSRSKVEPQSKVLMRVIGKSRHLWMTTGYELPGEWMDWLGERGRAILGWRED